MKQSIKSVLCVGGWFSESYVDYIAERLVDYIRTPEFSALYDAQRTHPSPDLGVGKILNHWRLSMSAATDAMAAAITTLQGQIKAGGVTADQVNTQIAAAVTPLTTQIQSIPCERR